MGGAHGGGVRPTDYFVLIGEGEAFARTNGENRVRLTAGQAVVWRKGERSALEIPAGQSCELLTVERNGIDPYGLCATREMEQPDDADQEV